MWDRTPGRYDLTATSRAGLRIELADIAGEIGGESDVAVLVGNETIGTGVRSIRPILLKTAVFRSSRPSALAICPVLPN